jgi:dienelactone hydrolase
VISVHGLLKPTGQPNAAPISAKVLALHGYDDPMAPPDDVLAFGREFTAAQADWQLHAYGNTVHAFTNPEATDGKGGLLYSASADRRSWHSLMQFLDEVLR